MHPPKIIEPLKALLVETQKSVILQSKFEGSPNLEVKWLHNGKEIKSKKGVSINKQEGVTTLHITKCSKQNCGKYEIVVINPVGEARSSGSLSLTGKFCYFVF